MSNDTLKPSLFLDSFLGDDIAEDNERFLLFVKAYYEWLQTTTITLVNTTGTFQRDETVIGSTSKATGIIREVQDGAIVIQYSTKRVFAKSETITGQTSGATSTIYSVKDNVVRASGNIVDYRTLETSIDKYFEYLRDELYTSLPVDFYGNKRLVASKFREFFSSKSSEKSYRFLFKLLYNVDIDFYYPGEDILRVSDGNFERTQIIRVSGDAFGIDDTGIPYTRNVFDFLNKTIRGSSSGALAFVVDIKKFFIGSTETAEMTLRLVSADFNEGETITDIEDEDLNATVFGIIAGFDIIDGGSGYQVGDIVSITGDGSDASAIVSSIKQSPITALNINATGHGYQLGTDATISNTGTGGEGLIIRVTDITNTYSYTDANTGTTYTLGEISEISIINRGKDYFAAPVITIQDTDIAPLGLLSDKLITIDNAGESYTVGDDLVFTGGSGANAAGIVASVTANSDFSNNLIFEDGFGLLFEQSYDDVLKTEDWDLGAIGSIRRIELTNFGDGYTNAFLPTITVNTSTGANAEFTVTGIQGSSANVTVDTANNATGVGSIRAVQMFNFGINYSTATGDASAYGDGNANLDPIISGIGVREGTWVDDDGKVNYKIIQDSFYFQDYSYVIKSGLTVEKYINTIKKTIHPAGLQVFGELLLVDFVNVSSTWRSSIETIKDFIVRIYDFITVTPAFGEFEVTIETKFESFTALQVALIPNTDLASQEYVIQVVPGGDDTVNIPYIGQSFDREIYVRVEQDAVLAEIETEVSPIQKMFVSYTQTFDAYTQTTYADLLLSEYEDVSISYLADYTFDRIYGDTLPLKLGEYVISLVPGGGDVSYTEDASVQTFRQHNFILELFWDNAVSIVFNDVSFAETGTQELIVDRITFINVEASYVSTEMIYHVGQRLLTLEVELSKEYTVYIESLGLANSEFTMIVAFSSVQAVKQQFAEGIVYLYGTPFSDVEISELAGYTFEENVFEGETDLGYTYASRTFENLWNRNPKSYSRYVIQYQNVFDDTVDITSKVIFVIEHEQDTTLVVETLFSFPIVSMIVFAADVVYSNAVPSVISGETNVEVALVVDTAVAEANARQEYVIQVQPQGFRYAVWDDETIGDYSANTIFNYQYESMGDSVTDKVIFDSITVPMFVSPWSNGKNPSGRSTPTDTVFASYSYVFSIFFDASTIAFSDIAPIATEMQQEIMVTQIADVSLVVPYGTNKGLVIRPEIEIDCATITSGQYTLKLPTDESNAYDRRYEDAILADYEDTTIQILADVEIGSFESAQVITETPRISQDREIHREIQLFKQGDISSIYTKFDRILEIPLDTAVLSVMELNLTPPTSSTNYYGLFYQDLPMEFLSGKGLEEYQDYVLSDPIANYILEDYISEDSFVTKYEGQSGTVSSGDAVVFSTSSIETFQNTPINALSSKPLSQSAGEIIGTSTNFTSEFAANDKIFIAGELFSVVAIANTEYMISDRLPETPFVDENIYKQA